MQDLIITYVQDHHSNANQYYEQLNGTKFQLHRDKRKYAKLPNYPA